jgi:hypothetical protein
MEKVEAKTIGKIGEGATEGRKNQNNQRSLLSFQISCFHLLSEAERIKDFHPMAI